MPGTKKGSSKVLSAACAECKRLKLKCSKTVPCGACVRRGCESICPQGRLKAGKGTRFILSDTKELHEEIDRLRSRITALEETIAVLREQQTNKVPTPVTRDAPTEMKVEEDEVPIDTFGSLTLKQDGSSEWYGRHMSAEYLFASCKVPQDDTEELLPLDLMFRSKMFPFKSSAQFNDAIRKQLRDYLPTRVDGWRIAHEYQSHVTWLQTPISWEEIVVTILEPVYNGSAKDEEIALFFVVCATGVSMDHQKQPDDPVARRYAHLARISLMLGEDLLCSKSLTVIRCLQGLAWFYHISLDPAGSSKAWTLTAMAVRMAQAAGLHRDSERWSNYPEEAEKRRKLWWEIATYEYVQSFSMARPRCIIVSQCDCKMPADPEDSGGESGFNRKKYKWLSECLLPIMDEAASTKSPPYSTVIKHDGRLRDYPMPDCPIPGEGTRPLPTGIGLLGAIVRLFSTDAMRELALLYLHRTYLVEALSRWPNDPVNSRFGLSVVAVHRSSLIILQGFYRIREHFTVLLPRIIGFWFQGIAAYICLCAIVIRSPGCSLAPSSMVEIERARKNFTQPVLKLLGRRSVSIEHAENVVESLYEQATVTYKAHQSGNWPLKQFSSIRGQADAHVLHLAGASNIHTEVCGDSMDDCTPTSASNSVGISPAIRPENIHPTLFEYHQIIQNGNTEIERPSDIYTTGLTTSEQLNGQASVPSSALRSLVSNVAATGPSPSSSEPPLFQTQAGSQSWVEFEIAQLPFAQRNTMQSIDPPFDSLSAFKSIFHFQNPSMSAQYPESTSAPQRVPAVGPSITPDNISGSIGMGTAQIGDLNALNDKDLARLLAESNLGLLNDGNGIGWDTLLTEWQAQF